MKRLPRQLVNGLTAISLALFLTSAFLSVCSRFRVLEYDSGGTWRVLIAQEEVRFVHEIDFPRRPASSSRWSIYAPYDGAFSKPTLGLSWARRDSQFFKVLEASVAIWWIAAASALLPLYWFLSGRHWESVRRRQTNLCIRCGYDLRATPDRCPECGTVPEGPK